MSYSFGKILKIDNKIKGGKAVVILLLLLLLLLLVTVIESSLGGSNPYTSTDKTNKNK
jgi:hypothetical protein